MKFVKVVQGIALALIVLFPALSLAESVPLSRVVDALETPFRGETEPGAAIKTFEARFHQQSLIASLEQMQEGGGNVQVKFTGPDKARTSRVMFRWIYATPSTQEIVSDGATVWVYLPENQQVLKTTLKTDSASHQENPMLFLTGLGNLSKEFAISWANPQQDDHGNFVLALQPKIPSTMVQSLQLTVAKDAVLASGKGKGPAFPLVSVHLSDGNGNSTRIDFTDVRVNPALSDGLFTFKVPEGVEVVSPQDVESGF